MIMALRGMVLMETEQIIVQKETMVISYLLSLIVLVLLFVLTLLQWL